MGDLTFKAPDDAKYPAMQLAYSAGRSGGTMTGVLSAANEQASMPYLLSALFCASSNMTAWSAHLAPIFDASHCCHTPSVS